MSTFSINLQGNVLRVGFVGNATNAEFVKDADERLAEMKQSWELKGGPLLKINGACSLPVACTIAHGVSHIYGSIAVWDPKLQKYVIVVSHHGSYFPGDLID